MKENPQKPTIKTRSVLNALRREVRSVEREDWSHGGAFQRMEEEKQRYLQGLESALAIVDGVARRSK